MKLPRIDLRPALLELGQELSLAALIGGNLFGRVAMGPALESISDKAERGKVLNRSWRRYGTVNSLALATLVGTWIPARQAQLGKLWVSRTDRALALAKDVTVGAVAVTGLASAAGGLAFSFAGPSGAVPLESGSEPAPETPGRAARLKRVVNSLGAANLGCEVALVAVNVTLLQRRRG